MSEPTTAEVLRRTVRRRTPSTRATERPMSAPDPILVKAFKFLTLKREAALRLLEAEGDRKKGIRGLRDDLLEIAMQRGEEDEKGHFFYDLPAPVQVDGDTYKTLKAERKAPLTLNEERTVALLQNKDLYERVVKYVPVLDDQELYVLNQEGLLSDDELDSLFDVNVSFSLKPLKG